jgi:hypothetical protein
MLQNSHAAGNFCHTKRRTYNVLVGERADLKGQENDGTGNKCWHKQTRFPAIVHGGSGKPDTFTYGSGTNPSK